MTRQSSEPCGSSSLRTCLPTIVASAGTRTSTISRLRPLQGHQRDQAAPGQLLLDVAQDQVGGRDGAVDAELAEQRLVLGVVDAGDGARYGELGLGDLAERQVVFVVARDGDHEVGALHAGALHGRGVAGVALHDHLGAQLLADEVDARRGRAR